MTVDTGSNDGLCTAGKCDACGAIVDWSATTCEHCGALFDAEALVAVFVTADALLLPLLKSALENGEVPYVVQGEGGLNLFPLGPFATGLARNLVAATILVPRGNAVAAVDVLGGLAEDEIEPDEIEP